ncbi:hypothetical protein MPSEU_000120300 [Mayamaea pseudoterrestris]|nr:hypothetical protein MPSEU_000120300 [Mayamaea pseudoterrestris]
MLATSRTSLMRLRHAALPAMSSLQPQSSSSAASKTWHRYSSSNHFRKKNAASSSTTTATENASTNNTPSLDSKLSSSKISKNSEKKGASSAVKTTSVVHSEHPRRVKVRRNARNSMNAKTPHAAATGELKQTMMPDVGEFVQRAPIEKITDCNQQTILSLSCHQHVVKSQLSSSSTDDQQQLPPPRPASLLPFTTNLPTLHVAALLDTRSYCVTSATAATTKSGTEASKRLLRGKKAVYTLLKKLVQRQANVAVPPQVYILEGHGVPHQLLQHHLILASDLLRTQSGNGDAGLARGNAYNNKTSPQQAQCSIQLLSNMTTQPQSPSNNDTSYAHHIDWMQVRRRKQGCGKTTTTSTRTVAVPREAQHGLQLYVTVMLRLARTLGSVVARQQQTDASSSGIAEAASGASKSGGGCPPKAWKATIEYGTGNDAWNLRSHHDPLSRSLANMSDKNVRPVVLVQWSNSTCRLLVQGFVELEQAGREDEGEASKQHQPQRLRRRRAPRPQPVSLSFEAVF